MAAAQVCYFYSTPSKLQFRSTLLPIMIHWLANSKLLLLLKLAQFSGSLRQDSREGREERRTPI